MKKLWLSILGLFCYAACCHADVLLSISPISQSVATSSAYASVDINIAGLGRGTALGVYDVTVNFDPNLLSYTSVVFSNQLDILGLGDIQSEVTGYGNLELFELSLDSPDQLVAMQASAFRLATLNFTVLGNIGTSPLNFTNVTLGDASGGSLSASAQDGAVVIGAIAPTPTMSPVPEPSSIVLVVSAFLGLPLMKLFLTRSI